MFKQRACGSFDCEYKNYARGRALCTPSFEETRERSAILGKYSADRGGERVG